MLLYIQVAAAHSSPDMLVDTLLDTAVVVVVVQPQRAEIVAYTLAHSLAGKIARTVQRNCMSSDNLAGMRLHRVVAAVGTVRYRPAGIMRYTAVVVALAQQRPLVVLAGVTAVALRQLLVATVASNRPAHMMADKLQRIVRCCCMKSDNSLGTLTGKFAAAEDIVVHRLASRRRRIVVEAALESLARQPLELVVVARTVADTSADMRRCKPVERIAAGIEACIVARIVVAVVVVQRQLVVAVVAIWVVAGQQQPAVAAAGHTLDDKKACRQLHIAVAAVELLVQLELVVAERIAVCTLVGRLEHKPVECTVAGTRACKQAHTLVVVAKRVGVKLWVAL